MRRNAFVLVAALLALPVMAQNVDIESLSGLQFNFGNPGARSLGMGGAFLGLSDDASAAEANPAGLTILRKAEISIEARNYLENQLFTTSGTYPEIERTAFPHHSDRVVVTFASAVLPVKNKFTIGAYFHQPLRNEGVGLVAAKAPDFTSPGTALPNFFLPVVSIDPVTRIPTLGDPISEARCDQLRETNPFACLEFRIDPFFSSVNVRLRTFGVAGAWQVHPKFSIGVTARHQRFLENASTFRFTQNLDLNTVVAQATASLKNGRIEDKEETDTTFAVGFKWSPTDKISVGGVYKKGPQFVTPVFFASGLTGFEFIEAGDTTFHIPDVAGLGISVRPLPALTVNVDAVRVQYSNLVDNFAALVGDVAALDESPFTANDVVELHLGAEYFFSTKIPFALRAGYWRDPAHSVEWTGPLNNPSFIAEAMLFPKGEAQNHFSIGAGVAWPRFQIDAAYDTSEQYKVGSISMVTRF
jgi:long-chain fatty acid transport protein